MIKELHGLIGIQLSCGTRAGADTQAGVTIKVGRKQFTCHMGKPVATGKASGEKILEELV